MFDFLPVLYWLQLIRFEMEKHELTIDKSIETITDPKRRDMSWFKWIERVSRPDQGFNQIDIQLDRKRRLNSSRNGLCVYLD